VAVAFRDFGFKHLESWIAPFVARCGYQPRLRVVQLSVVDRWIYKLFRSSFVSAMRRDIDVSRHHASLLHFGHAMELREPLQIPNKLCAYVYLVDGRGRIRWRASGEATPAEVDEMLEVTEHLIDEAKGEEAGGGGGGRGRGKRGRR
jgi:ATPase complex subunit ATP10